MHEVVAALGDDIFMSRVTWLEGRIAAGLGRNSEARRLLEQARKEFADRGMDYDVALALLEEAILLLADGGTSEVKELALGLKRAFESKEIHREATGSRLHGEEHAGPVARGAAGAGVPDARRSGDPGAGPRAARGAGAGCRADDARRGTLSMV